MKAGIYRTPNGNLIYVAKDRTIKATTLSPSSWPGTKVTTEANGARVVIDVGGSDYVCHRASDVPNGCTDPQAELIRVQMRLYPEPEVVQEDIYAGVRTKIYDSEQALPRAASMPATLGMGYGKDLERETEKPRLSGRASQLLLQEGKSEEMIQAVHDNLIARGAVHVAHDEYMLPSGAGKTGSMSGGPLSSNLPRHIPATGHADALPDDGRRWKADASFTPEESAVITDWINDTAMRTNGYRPCHAQSARKHRKKGHTVIADGARPGAYWWRPQFWGLNTVVLTRRELKAKYPAVKP